MLLIRCRNYENPVSPLALSPTTLPLFETCFPKHYLWLVLWHFRPNPTAIDSVVYTAVLDGDFPPIDWATIIWCRKNAADYNYHMDIWKTSNYPIEELNTINSCRAAIYLDSIEDYKKKWVIARELERRKNTEYNPNYYDPGINNRYLFIFLNSWLLPSDELINAGFSHF